MDGVVRQLYDYDGSNLFPKTKPSAFVSDLYNSSAEGITTIGELINSSVPGKYKDPGTNVNVDYEPEFVYRIPGSDSSLTGDEKGTLKAVKLTHVSALHFDARLTEDITVSYQVGQATMGKVYRAGTFLEDIIRDMLTGGGTVYDIQKVLPNVSFTSVQLSTNNGVSWNTITNNGSTSVNVGTAPKIKFAFTFTDGQYRPVTGYSDDLFTLRNNISVNEPYYLTDTSGRPYLITNSSTDSLTITNNVSGESNPRANTTYIKTLNTVNSNDNKLYTITLHYSTNSNATSTPYKSDGTPSNIKVESGICSTTFKFYITGVDVSVYDVIVYDMPALTVGSFVDETDNIGVDVYNRDYNSSDRNANLILMSDYDISHESSTGIWTNDSVSLFTKKKLYPGWTYTYDDNTPVEIECDNGASYPVVSPVIYYRDGIFKKADAYPVDTFQQNNPKASHTFLYAQCELTTNPNPSVGIYKGDVKVHEEQAAYNTKITKVISVWEHPNPNTSIAYEYALWFNDASNALINTGSTKLSAGNYTIKFKVPHTANTVIPKKSNNTNSQVGIPAGTLIVISNDFTVKQEVDVSTVNPVITINNLTINGASYNNGDSITAPAGNKISGSVTFTCSNGRFRPASSTYTNAEFGANHGVGSTDSLNAECVFSSFTLHINTTSKGTYTPTDTSTDSSIIGTISFSEVPIANNGFIDFYVAGVHSASTVQPYKRSTRESSANIPANSSLLSNTLKLTITGTAGYTITIKSSPSTAGKVKFDGGNWGTNLNQVFASDATAIMYAQAANINKVFSHWTMDNASVGQSNPYTYTVTGNHTFVANFIDASVNPKYVWLLSTDNLYNAGDTELYVNNVEDVLTYHKIKPSYIFTTDIANSINENPLTITLDAEQLFGSGKKWVTAIIPTEYASSPNVRLLDRNGQEGWTLQDGTEISGIKPYSDYDNTSYIIITKRASDAGVAVKTIECNK